MKKAKFLLLIVNFTLFSAGVIEEEIDQWFKAAKKGDIDTMQKLMPKVGINAQDSDGRTALIWAAYKGHENVVKLLLESPGININLRDRTGYSAIKAAASNGRENVIKLLLTIPEIDINSLNEALIVAIGYENIVKLLLSVKGVNVNTKDIAGKTPLMFAAHMHDDDIVKFLLTVPGIDINAQSNSGYTPLMYAEFNNNIVRLLLNAGANVNAQDERGNTALMHAAGAHDSERMALLLDAGADQRITNKEGKTALDFGHYLLGPEKLRKDLEKLIVSAIMKREAKVIEAAKMGEAQFNNASKIITEMHKLGINLDVQDPKGITPLMWAAATNNKKMVELLLKLGANPRIKNTVTGKGEDAIDVARKAGYVELANLMEKST